MKLWFASMECAGIVEAGGVKNVTLALCKGFSLLKHKVTLFIPVFKSNSYDKIYNLQKKIIDDIEIFHCGKNEVISYDRAFSSEGDFEIIFIKHPSFYEKEDIYTYTEHEQLLNPMHIKGTGHLDTLFMDTLFAKAVFNYAKNLPNAKLADIIHCQDASTALIPSFFKTEERFNNVKSVVTIHNAGPAYHHNFSSIGDAAWYTGFDQDLLASALNDYKVEPFLLAHNSGAYLTTVSDSYAEELVDPSNNDITEGLSGIFSQRGITIKGITNGIDYDRYNPQITEISELPFPFNPEKNQLEGKYKCREYFIEQINNKTLIQDLKIYGSIDESNNYDSSNSLIYLSYHGRITNQKGISVLIESIPAILKNYSNVRFIITGQGQLSFEKKLIELSESYKGKLVFLNGYNKVYARLTNAIADFMVLPSFFEPCGLEDFISQIFGTLPIANKTGGLNKILDKKTGFLYLENTPLSFIAKVSEVISIKINAPKKIDSMIKAAALYVRKNYLWRNVVEKKYLTFFKEILKKS